VIETESMNFVIAIAFTTGMIMLIVGMFGFHLVVSGKRLRKAQRLADAALEFTPALMTIVFDARDRVVDLKVRNPAFERHFRETFIGKKKEELSFLPMAVRNPNGSEAGATAGQETNETRAPLKMPDGNVIYLEWEMQDSTDNTDFRIAWGFDITTELLHTQRKLRVLSAISSEAEERERKRIAEDLHDRIGEILITSSRLLDELKKRSPSTELSGRLEALDETIKKFTRGTRSLISDLVPPVLYSVGFAAAVESLALDFKRQHNIAIRVEDALQDYPINQELAIFLYKAVREFIRNAMKHGGADEILISLSRTDHTVAVTVQDNGSGFASASNPLAPNSEAGFGLFNVKNRAEYYNGDVAIAGSTDLGGGKITVWVSQPLRKEGRVP